MIRKFAALLAGVAIFAGGFTPRVQAQPAHGVDPAVIDRIVAGCTAEEAFGHRFGDRGESPRARLGPGWGPFDKLDLVRNKLTQELAEVDAMAHYGDAPGSTEDRQARARSLFEALIARAEADGRFVIRVEEGEGEIVNFSSSETEGEGFGFELTLFGAGLYVGCVDHAGVAKAWKDGWALATGQVRIDQRPVPPASPLPARHGPEACAAPESRRNLLDGFETATEALLDYATASSRYAETLAAWKGQQLVDKGVWTKAKKDAFALSVMSDPLTLTELQANMKRLESMLGVLGAYGEALQAGDDARACAEAVRALELMNGIVDSNTRQWARMHQRYDAEAKRLGVTID